MLLLLSFILAFFLHTKWMLVARGKCWLTLPRLLNKCHLEHEFRIQLMTQSVQHYMKIS